MTKITIVTNPDIFLTDEPIVVLINFPPEVVDKSSRELLEFAAQNFVLAVASDKDDPRWLEYWLSKANHVVNYANEEQTAFDIIESMKVINNYDAN